MPMSPRLLRPRAAGGFDPRSISGLALWLDAADSATLFDATTGGSLVAADGGVGRWQDKSGNSVHATQGTANNRPQRKVGAVNGKDAIFFDGVNDSFTTASLTQAQPLTILAVASHQNASGVNAQVIDGVTNRVVIGKGNGTSGGLLFAGAVLSATNVFLSNTTTVITGIANGSTSVLRKDGAQIASGNAGTSSLGTTVRVGVGSVGNTEFWNGNICELLVYGSALSASQLTTLERYLGTKWGVTVA